LGSEIRALHDETLGGLDDLRAELRFDDDREHVPVVRRQGAMHMRFVRGVFVSGLERASLGLLVRVRSEILRGMPMDKLSVLRAPIVLDEEHVAPARALHEERE